MARPRKNPANTVNFKLIYSQWSAGRKCCFFCFSTSLGMREETMFQKEALLWDVELMRVLWHHTLTMWLIQNPHSITVIKHECKLISFMFFVKYVFSINFSFCVLNLNNDNNDLAFFLFFLSVLVINKIHNDMFSVLTKELISLHGIRSCTNIA